MNEFSQPDPSIKEFREQFEKVANEITSDGETLLSHKISCRVLVECVNDDSDFVIMGLDISQLLGCGCWSDIKLVIKKVEE